MDAVELEIHRYNTELFIDADPVQLVLTPMSKTADGAGGKRLIPGPPRPSQKLRLIPQTDVMPAVQTLDGIQLTPTYVLMGLHDASFDRWDMFTLDGDKYQIVSPVRPEHSTESVIWRKADVARR